MDISKTSNLERFVFDLVGRDTGRIKALFDDLLRNNGYFDLGGEPAFAQAACRFGFRSGEGTHANRLATIRDTWERFGTVIDPHTADGLRVAREHADPEVPMLVLETALPIKFAETINEALGREPDRPQRFEGIEDRPRGFAMLPVDTQAVKTYIAERLPSADR